jgi:putative FmdB family regulatory protein
MPTYEYQCENGHHFDATQRITEEPISACVTCGVPAKRLISRTSFVLKGGGWTPTTYGR